MLFKTKCILYFFYRRNYFCINHFFFFFYKLVTFVLNTWIYEYKTYFNCNFYRWWFWLVNIWNLPNFFLTKPVYCGQFRWSPDMSPERGFTVFLLLLLSMLKFFALVLCTLHTYRVKLYKLACIYTHILNQSPSIKSFLCVSSKSMSSKLAIHVFY